MCLRKLSFKTVFIQGLSFLAIVNICSAYNDNFNIYEIEKDGKVSYLIGVSHNVPLSYIQEGIQKIIKSQDYLVIEHLPSNDWSEPELRLNETESCWWNELSPNQQATLSQLPLTCINANQNIANYKLSPVFLSVISFLAEKRFQQETNNPQMQEGISSNLQKLYPNEKVLGIETLSELIPILNQSFLSDIDTFKEVLSAIPSLLNDHTSEDSDNANNDKEKEFNDVIYYDPTSNSSSDTSNSSIDGDSSAKAYEIVVDQIDNRHALWIDRIENFHKSLTGNILFAFGDDHLPGDQGIIKLLEDHGFIITQLIFDSASNSEDSNEIDL